MADEMLYGITVGVVIGSIFGSLIGTVFAWKMMIIPTFKGGDDE